LAINAGVLFAVNSGGGGSIQKFSLAGVDAGSITSSFLNGPTGLAFGNDGNLYVANSGNGFIHKFSPSGTYVGQFAETGLGSLGGISFDMAQNIYVTSDTNDSTGKYSFAGADLGQLTSAGNAGPRFVAVTAIPEPGTTAVIFGAFIALFAFIFRGRRISKSRN
jgi:DNA-binding beta-propeller fold protein YncE